MPPEIVTALLCFVSAAMWARLAYLDRRLAELESAFREAAQVLDEYDI